MHPRTSAKVFYQAFRVLRTIAGESPEGGKERYVLKHISSRKGERARRSGRREAYFGARLQLNRTIKAPENSASSNGLDHLVRFVESFEVGSLGHPRCEHTASCTFPSHR